MPLLRRGALIFFVGMFLGLFCAQGALVERVFKTRINEEPVEVYTLADDGKAPLVHWRALTSGVFPNPGKSIPEIAAAQHAVAAVNANFYREDEPGEQEPIGLVVQAGRLLSFPNKFYPTAGVFEEKLEWDHVEIEAFAELQGGDLTERKKLCRLNASPPSANCASLWSDSPPSKTASAVYFEEKSSGVPLGETEYRPRGGWAEGRRALQWPSKIPANVTSIKLVIRLKGKRLGDRWRAVREAVSGSHVLTSVGTSPAMTRPWAKARQPRSFLGVDRQGRAWIAVFDGRRAESHGVSVKDAWRFVQKNLLATWALNLDGGGSTALVYQGRLMNKPSDGFPRPIAVAFGAELKRKL